MSSASGNPNSHIADNVPITWLETLPRTITILATVAGDSISHRDRCTGILRSCYQQSSAIGDDYKNMFHCTDQFHSVPIRLVDCTSCSLLLDACVIGEKTIRAEHCPTLALFVDHDSIVIISFPLLSYSCLNVSIFFGHDMLSSEVAEAAHQILVGRI